MKETSTPTKSLVEQILEETFSRIQNTALFSDENVETLRKLAAKGEINKESLTKILTADCCEEFYENP